MKKNSRTKLCVPAGLAASFAAIALAVAAGPGAGNRAPAYFFVGGHTFGIGEQQVYAIERYAELTVHYRDASGALRSTTHRRAGRTSVALTIEGIASAAGPVLGVATAAATAPASTTLANEPSPQSPPPSPVLDQQGAANPSGALAELATASIILSGIIGELPATGKPWQSSGQVDLPYATVTVDLNNVVNSAAGDENAHVIQIASRGTTDVQGKLAVAGLGLAMLRGGGTAAGTSFVESQSRLFLGMNLEAISRGNANSKQRRGSYDLKLRIAIKLVKYVPGIPPLAVGPGFVPASGSLGGIASPDTGVYSTVVPNPIAVPAATDTGFIPPPPVPAATPYHSALPEVSLPPVPIPIASDQPLASPPPGPTPTPTPTRY